MRGSKKKYGGGGGTGPTARKQSGQPFFVFLVLNLITVDRGDPMLLLQRKLYFFKDPEGSRVGGGGSGPPILPLDPHMTPFGCMRKQMYRSRGYKTFSCSTQLSTKFQLLMKTDITANEDVSWFKSLRCCSLSC